jgi:hypothetical protein
MRKGGVSNTSAAERAIGKGLLKKSSLLPTKRLDQDVAETLRTMASKYGDLSSSAVSKAPKLLDGENRSNDSERPEESDACYETEDFQVLESQLIVDDTTDSIVDDGTTNESEHASSGKAELPWNFRTSFTADSPYFDAFVTSEMQSFSILSETLNGIAAQTRAFVKQGAIMSDLAKRLSLSCKLRSSDFSDDDTTDSGFAANVEEEFMQQRRSAIGEEMAGILELLGEVRSTGVSFR